MFKFYDEYFPGIAIYTNGYVNKTDLEIKLFGGEITKLKSSFEVTAGQIQIELKSILNDRRLNLVNENDQISFHSARVILQRQGSSADILSDQPFSNELNAMKVNHQSKLSPFLSLFKEFKCTSTTQMFQLNTSTAIIIQRILSETTPTMQKLHSYHIIHMNRCTLVQKCKTLKIKSLYQRAM